VGAACIDESVGESDGCAENDEGPAGWADPCAYVCVAGAAPPGGGGAGRASPACCICANVCGCGGAPPALGVCCCVEPARPHAPAYGPRRRFCVDPGEFAKMRVEGNVPRSAMSVS